MPNRLREIRHHMVKLGIGPVVLDALIELIRANAQVDPDFEQQADVPVAIADVGAIAKQFHRSSLRRGEVIGQPVADPGWNMLLALIADTSEARPSSVTSLCYASGAPMTTALRHLKRLETSGLVRRRGHEQDGRRAIIEALPTTIATMSELIVSFCVQPPSPP